ncbi:MAG: hypothetical protein EA416_09635 [Trueperaceae bacterium]|jgi:hypothetical protein|nr:MAG: hypothetical protein EA416_09635 [Trueperaceae bacterium]
MATFTVGEEVLFEDERYVVSEIDRTDGRYRLLATTPVGARVVWAPYAALRKLERYTTALDDTSRMAPRR